MSQQTDKTSAFRKVGPCLYRYSNDVYYARFKSGGKEIRCSLETTDRKLAERNLAEKKKQQSRIDRSKSKITLGELCDSYLKTLHTLKSKTRKQKTGVVEKIKKHWPTGKAVQVTKIKPTECDQWLARFQFGAASRNFYVQVLKEVFNAAVADGIIADSPAHRRNADGKQRLKYVRRAKPIRRTPTFEQFNAIVESIRSQKFNGHNADESADFVEFIGLAGLGQAETSALTWGDIDFEREQIITFRYKTKSGFAIPLFPQLRPLLERRYAQRHPGVDRVFKIADAKKAIAAACKRLKMPAFSHRSFRRMFITRAIERGVDVKVIAEWQGHKDGGKLILDTYSHVNRAHSQRMAMLMITEEPDNVVSLERKGAA
jgi:integrase